MSIARIRHRFATLFITMLFASTLFALAACAAPPTTAPAATYDDVAPAAATPAADPMNLPGAQEPASGPVQVDRSCKTNADCTVKDVGNCCGYYPACVNVNSPTDPEGVRAACAKSGMMSVCGFREISSCQCVEGKCEAANGGALPAIE
ncbi:hypothetical protein FKV23_12305 [Lysobacter alkalisoli]|uniref:Secreted protein n=2 Tax=Marilutibacter alkalisoli TaxID=2591633 RepID=A0A514BU04_9GAMM|nr:hypothetical protein FKV23_12305 [Lysobacter alkalisoli]